MITSNSALIWMIYATLAFILLPGIGWLVDAGVRRGYHTLHRPPRSWAAHRQGSHRARFEEYRHSA